jgi:hypothetical protein
VCMGMQVSPASTVLASGNDMVVVASSSGFIYALYVADAQE